MAKRKSQAPNTDILKLARDHLGEISVARGAELKRRRSQRGGIARWPIVAKSLGGSHKQRGDLAEHLRKCGVPTEVTPEGDPIVTSQKHQRRVARAVGFRNKDDYFR